MAHKILTQVEQETGQVNEAGVIAIHKITDQTLYNGRIVMELLWFLNESCKPNPLIGYAGKRPLKNVVDSEGNVVYQCIKNFDQNTDTSNIEKLAHDTVTVYLESSFGFFNVQDLQYGEYIEKAIENQNNVIVDQTKVNQKTYCFEIKNVGENSCTFSIGSSIDSSDIKELTTLTSNGLCYVVNVNCILNSTYINTNGKIIIKAKKVL